MVCAFNMPALILHKCVSLRGKASVYHAGASRYIPSRIVTGMDDTRIAARIASLCDEIKAIQDSERRYRTAKHRSRADRMAHASRELRLLEI